VRLGQGPVGDVHWPYRDMGERRLGSPSAQERREPSRDQNDGRRLGGSTPAVWGMTGKRSTGQLEGAAGPSSDSQPTPVLSLRKRSKGQDRVEPARRRVSGELYVGPAELESSANLRSKKPKEFLCGVADLLQALLSFLSGFSDQLRVELFDAFHI
jgi:hypothetical protein